MQPSGQSSSEAFDPVDGNAITTLAPARIGETNVEETCRQEIIRLHQIIEQWFCGHVPQSNEAFAPFQDALAEGFHIVQPSGVIQDKANVVSNMWQAHGARSAPFRIEIRNPVCYFVLGSCCLMTYEEWQYGHETTARLSTVLFRQTSTHLGVEWLHLHETWLPNDGQANV